MELKSDPPLLNRVVMHIGPIFPSYGYYAVFLFACTFLLSSQYANSSQIRSSWVEKTLIKDLLHDYEKRARPVVDGVSPEVSIGNYSVQQIKVEYGMALMQILQLDENEQILTVSVRSLYRWSDHHLIWNPEDYDNITHITIPTSKIWIPDVALYNYADERLEERRDCAAKVSHNGVVEWHPMAIYKSTCAVKIKYFPYDKQNCTLKFGPWTYDAGRVNGTLYDVDWNLKEYKESPEWKLLKHRAWTKTEKYDCCAEIYADLMFELIIERQPAYYNYLLILPCFLLSSLTLVVFWLPPENPAKMVLGMNIFVAFFLLLLLLKSSIPSASSSFPLIGNYYCANMTLVTLSTFLCLIVVNLHYRGDRRNEVPPWLRKLAIQHGARLLFVNVAPPGGPKSKSPDKKGNKPVQPVQSNDVTSQPLYGSAFGFYPGAPRLPYSDAYGLNPNLLRSAQMMQFPPGSERLYYRDGYYGNHQPMPYPVRENVNPFYQIGEYSIPPSQYANQMEQYGRFLEYANRAVPPNDRSRVCAFCPACAGLAAAAAVTGATNDLEDPDLTDAASIDQHLPSPLPPQQQHVIDPAEDLTAVWEAAMSGSTPRRKQIVSSNGTEGRGQRLPSTDRDECMSGLTTARNRSLGPDLEAFLLECIHPKSSKKAISAANTQWKGSERQQRQQHQQQGLPSSPFYHFSSPHCEEDADEASLERWPSTGQVDSKPEINTHDDEDEESGQFVTNDLWRSNSSGAIHTKVKRPSMAADPVLLKRVHTVKRDVSEVVRCLRFMQRQTENQEKTNKLINEWRAVGMVLDRLFFVSYLFALGISIIIYFPRSGGELDLDGGP